MVYGRYAGVIGCRVAFGALRSVIAASALSG